MTEMRSITTAVVRDQGAPFAIEEAKIASPQGGEVLVRIVAVGGATPTSSCATNITPSRCPPSSAMKVRAWSRRWGRA